MALRSGPTPGEDRRRWARLTFSLSFLCRRCVFLPTPRPRPSLLHVALTLSVGCSALPSDLNGQKPAHQPWQRRPQGLLPASGKKSHLPHPVGLAEALPALWWFAGGEDLPGGCGRTAGVPRPGGERHVCRALRASWTGAGAGRAGWVWDSTVGLPWWWCKSPHTGRPQPLGTGCVGAETGLCCGESLKGENHLVTAAGPSQQMTSRPPVLNRLPRGGPHPQRPHHLPGAGRVCRDPGWHVPLGLPITSPQSPAQESGMTPFPARSTLTPELDPTCPDQEQM